MQRTRVTLTVEVDLDPVPGVFHTTESARNVIGVMLNRMVGHYHPEVSIAPDELKLIRDTANTMIVGVTKQEIWVKDSDQGRADTAERHSDLVVIDLEEFFSDNGFAAQNLHEIYPNN